MGFEYALVHLKYTIPPAVLLTLLYRPLFTTLDAYKICFLTTVAVFFTIPWDSYLIRTNIWSYPRQAIIGPKMLDIPYEEIFFFIIQTYNTSLLYIILTKPTFQPAFLRAETVSSNFHGFVNLRVRRYKLLGQVFFGAAITVGLKLVKDTGNGTYAGLILLWAVPILLLLWTLAYQFIISLPYSNTLMPIALPTLYLWLVDTLALKRGTWVISNGTKSGRHLWDGLEIEEALFFLLTNTLIVFGQLAFDNALSVLYTFPISKSDALGLPPPITLIRALLRPTSTYDLERLRGLQEAVWRLKKKSRSFYLASSTFQGLIRNDLLLLYSFCRVADDLVDNASSKEEASVWIGKLHKFLDLVYGGDASWRSYVTLNFPDATQSALYQLPVAKLSRRPLDGLLHGFEMDLSFDKSQATAPIETEYDLELYGHRVAGTVAEMCVELIFHDFKAVPSHLVQRRIVDAGNRMGIALQYVNIARDIAVDADMGRVYLPLKWLNEEELTYNAVLESPHGKRVEKLRLKLLNKAFQFYEDAKAAIEDLPTEARGPIRVAVESYMEIGRILRQTGYVVKDGRATVPKGRRLRVAWNALSRRYVD